jgi:ribonuclease D
MYLLELRDRLRDELVRLGRWEWAAEEFARLEGTRWEPEDADQSFLRVKGARDLNRRELAILRELVRWRDATARAADRATFRVMSNEVLLEIARLRPAEVAGLKGIKGMPRGILESRGGEILQCIGRGNAVAEDQLPRFPKAPRWDRDPDFETRVAALRAVRDEAAKRLDLDPGVLCSRERLESIARRQPSSLDELAEMSELRRWQVAELGSGVMRALGRGARVG